MKLYGNEHALAALEAMCTSGRLPHSFLIYGEQGTGKKTLAWYLAARLLCEGAQKPCGSCKPCHNLEHRQHPDVMENVTELIRQHYGLDSDETDDKAKKESSSDVKVEEAAPAE